MVQLVTAIIGLLLFSTQPASAQRVDPNFHIYLLTGQSNMAGRGVPDSNSKQVDPRILMLNKKGQWVPATDPMHFDKPDIVGVGPGLAFAKAMLTNDPNIRIGLVPCAWGGSPIRVWEPDSAYLTGHPYDDAIARGRLAMRSGVLKGILWHQGESDNNPAGMAVYTEKFKQLATRFRKDFNAPRLPIIAGEIGYFGKSTAINDVLNALPNDIPYVMTVSAAGLTDKGDQTHFDTPSARKLGERYAEAMKKFSTR